MFLMSIKCPKCNKELTKTKTGFYSVFTVFNGKSCTKCSYDLSKAQGGRWSSGFWSGVASSAFAPTVGKYLSKTNEFVQAAVVGVLSGTVSQIAGGKFANGAVTGAFTYLFNYKAHEGYIETALGNPSINPVGKKVNNFIEWGRGKGKSVARILSTSIAGTFTGAKLGARLGPAGLVYGASIGTASGLVVGMANEGLFNFSRPQEVNKFDFTKQNLKNSETLYIKDD